jgi:hypothetical protein
MRWVRLCGSLCFATGLSAHAVAAALGHESVKTTLQSYAKAGAGAGARQTRVLDVLKGGRTNVCSSNVLQTRYG